MSKIIAFGNLKGGTGKSTLSVNVACAIAEAGFAVSLIDADPQGTTSAWLDRRGLNLSVEALPLETLSAAAAWVKRTHQLRTQDRIIILDLPPVIGSSIATAMLICDLFVVPVTPSFPDIHATTKVMKLLRKSRSVRRAGMPKALLVPSRVDRRTSLGRNFPERLAAFGEPVAPSVIQRSAHVEASNSKSWIGAHAPGTTAHFEVTSVADVVCRMTDIDYDNPADADIAKLDMSRLRKSRNFSPAKSAGIISLKSLIDPRRSEDVIEQKENVSPPAPAIAAAPSDDRKIFGIASQLASRIGGKKDKASVEAEPQEIAKISQAEAEPSTSAKAIGPMMMSFGPKASGPKIVTSKS